MASAEIAELRQLAHRSFDRIWRHGDKSRGAAYKWLAQELGVAPEEAHMGVMTDADMLRRVIELSDNYVGETSLDEDFNDPPPMIPER